MTKSRSRTIKRIHVDQHAIRRNKKRSDGRLTGDLEPAITVQNRGRSIKAYDITLLGRSRVIYRPDKPLSCGAHCWVETQAAVIVDGETIY